MKIETVWEYSLKTEAQRVLHAAHQMVVGFYRVNNFYVIPLGSKSKYSSSIVKFPHLPYSQIHRFWEKTRTTVNVDRFPLTADKKLLEDTENLLKSENLLEPDFSKVKMTWSQAQDEVFDAIEKIMPEKVGFIKKIIIHPTVLGTTCSFSYLKTKDGSMYIYLREDQDIYSITEAILTYITRVDVYEDLSGNWSESELLVDWLLTKSAINKVLKKYAPKSNFVPTLLGTRVKQTANLLNESENFYKNLGLPSGKKVFEINGTEPTIYKMPTNNFTPTEKVIFKLLIEKANNIASFDDLGNVLFKSEDDFSLYAISKQIERLRNKLEENGISGSYIQTLRGQGYILRN